MLPPRCALPSARSTPSCHRFDQVHVSPALCPCEPCRPHRKLQAVSCGARSDALLFPASSVQPRSAQIRSVRTYNAMFNVYFSIKTVLTLLGHVRLSRKKTNTGSSTRFRSFLAEFGPAWRETAGFTNCAPRRTHSRWNPRPKRPSAFLA